MRRNFWSPFPRGKGLGVRFLAGSQRLPDTLNHRFAIEHCFIRYSENSNAHSRDRLVALFVVFPLFLMHAAIQLDRQFAGIAIEIDDIFRDRLLTPEMEPVNRVSPNDLPKNALGPGHVVAQSFGKRELLGLNTLDPSYFAAMCHKLIADAKEPNP
jgi:hypothetical protein